VALSGARLRFAAPHAVLAAGAAVVLAAELGYDRRTSDAWLFLEAAVALAALLYAWREQERLRLRPLLVLALVFQLAWIVLHWRLRVSGGFDASSVSVRGDVDTKTVFPRQGNALLDGRYPRSEYPVGAVLLFALEAWLGGSATRTLNAFLMVPFQLVCVACVWACRTRYGAWLAAVVALWPLNAFSWEFKFDLVPAALLLLGLVLALRGRWGLAGTALGLGFLVKWTPALAFAALLLWLAASARWRDARRHALAFAVTVAVVYVPFLVWSPANVLAAYTRQGGRTITPESVWYLLLRPLGLASVHGHISRGAGAPGWADVAAAVVQALLVLGTLVAAARAPSLPSAVAVAALAPVVFLATNRIFSPQFLVPMLAAWALAGALVVASRRRQLALALAALGASFANAFVYPFALPRYDATWPAASALLFALALGLTAWLVAAAYACRRATTTAIPSETAIASPPATR
jgi:hypothetical protein